MTGCLPLFLLCWAFWLGVHHFGGMTAVAIVGAVAFAVELALFGRETLREKRVWRWAVGER